MGPGQVPLLPLLRAGPDRASDVTALLALLLVAAVVRD